MTDITMCPGHNCPKRDNCRRYTAEPSARQSYFFSTPWDGVRCEFYWPMNEENTKTKVRLTEVFDDDGNMLRIVVKNAETGNHLFDALWDPTEKQTQENRQRFRGWTNLMLARKNLEPVN